MNASSRRRYPVDIKGLGLIQHGRQKTYMMSVLWSDSNNILIYRTFEEFKKLHKDLKRRFLIEAGWFKKSEQVLPRLKDAPLIFRKARDSNRDMERLKLLETYSQDLLQTDAKVSQCEEVTQFYMPQSRDLDPTFQENSIVIMPSDAGDERKETSRVQTDIAIIEPIKSAQYQCVEAFEVKDTKSRPFKVNKGDMLDVLLKDTTGWWLVENEEKRLAWFPAPYLQKTGTAEEPHTRRESQHGGTLYFAVKSYEAKNSDEVSVDVGVVVEVVEKSDNGWWLVWYNGRTGYLPSMFLKPYRNPHQRFQVILKQGVYTSTPNLHKASSALNVAASSNQRAFEDDPSRKSAARKRLEQSRAALNRRKSRSLSGLPTTPSRETQCPLGLELDRLKGGAGGHNLNWKPTPRPRKVIRGGSEDGDPPSKTHSSLIAWSTSISKDSESDDSALINGSDPALDSSINFPVMPPRPRTHEILQKCTTVTKKAALKNRQQRIVL